MRKAYQSDLSDAEWSCLESHLPASRADGRPRIYPLREILDAIFYLELARIGSLLFIFAAPPHD
jgi:putative transposase